MAERSPPVRIPPIKGGTKPMLTTAKLRIYGAGGFKLWDGHEAPGCPAQYRAKYESFTLPPTPPSTYLLYGRVIHEALRHMEDETTGPHEALEAVWDPALPLERMEEAQRDLDRYLERGGPMTRFGSIATEIWLEALLYTDEVYGPTYFGGYIDNLALDMNDPHTLRVIDYKAGWAMPKREEIQRDPQLIAYDWLVRQNWDHLGMTGSPDVVCYLDVIKWKETEVRYAQDQLDTFQEWATAVARRIWRDEESPEIVNPGCPYCPRKMDCKAYKRLPGLGAGLLEKRVVTHLPKLVRWRKEAMETVKILESGIEEVKAQMEEHVRVEGPFEVDGERWYLEPTLRDEMDLARLMEVIGINGVLSVVSVTKRALDAYLRTVDDETKQAVRSLWVKAARGTTLKAEAIE